MDYWYVPSSRNALVCVVICLFLLVAVGFWSYMVVVVVVLLVLVLVVVLEGGGGSDWWWRCWTGFPL